MRSRSAAIAIRSVALIAAAIAIHCLCILPFRGNLVLRDVERRSEVADTLPPQRAVVLARTNLRDLDRIAATRRLDPSWYLLYGANCQLLERWPEAADAYTGALRIDDRPEIYVNRGFVYLRLGRTDDAASDFITAARFDPRIVDEIEGELRTRVEIAAGLR